jgi:DNA recombination protein RmuC
LSFFEALSQFTVQLEPVSVLLGFTGGLTLCTLLFFLARQNRERKVLVLNLRLERLQEECQSQAEELQRLQGEYRALIRECRDLDVDNAALQSACSTMRQQLEERDLILAENRRHIEQHFQAAADRILHQQNDALTRRHESTLNLLLRPLHDQLGEFRQRLDKVHAQESKDRILLQQELEQLRRLNQQLSSDAINLAEALRGKNKFQGQWGELILARVLEASGLRQGREFELQVHLKAEGGSAYQPDAVVRLPDKRDILIDAKVSLKDFTDAINAASPEEQQASIQRHLVSVKRQINLLATKQYHKLGGLGALDFVLLFIPVEGAFQMVVEQDPDLLVQAMQKKIILSSPSTLLAILRTIHHLWRVDEQHKNSLAIAKQAASIYDKLVGFVESFNAIGLRLNQTQQAWHTAKNRLTSGHGNLIAKAEGFKDLGVQPNKELPPSVNNQCS